MGMGSAPRADRGRGRPARLEPRPGDPRPSRSVGVRPRAGRGLYLGLDQRAFVTGKSGSGKSYLARRWVRGWQSGIAIDHKHNGIPPAELPGWDLVLGCRTALAAWGPQHPRLIVRPQVGDTEPGGPYEVLAERVLLTGWTGWYDDEVANVAPVGRLNRGLERLVGEGRARFCPVVVATQRPIGVHNKLMSEAEHLVVFRLQLRGDREKLAGYAGERLLEPDLLAIPHSFAHYRSDTGELTVYGPLPA